jgi:hypothetical protein
MATSLIEDQKVILYALIDEAKLIASTGDPNATPTIRIEGGLPRLPGTSVIMPDDPPYQPGFQDPANPIDQAPGEASAPKPNGHDPDPAAAQAPPADPATTDVPTDPGEPSL